MGDEWEDDVQPPAFGPTAVVRMYLLCSVLCSVPEGRKIVLTLFSVPAGQTVEILLRYFLSLRDEQ